jgi:VanZ family protein
MSLRLLRILAAGVTLTIWVLSLIPIEQAMVPGGDKFHHFIAYASVMLAWRFATPTHTKWQQLFVAVSLMAMGLAIEFLQGLTPYRFFEWADALANSVGVMIGWALSFVLIKLLPAKWRQI